jgi:adenine-specific DNA-methyltransferase
LTRRIILLDFFAGSGTTGHAVINLNREDGGRRKFILVEMADYFDTVLLPRLKKVIFTPEWKEGKPKRMATDEEAKRSPRILKVIRLESYEDALNNLTFDEASGQTMLDCFGDEYLLRYMLVWETRRSETLLNVEKLTAPFCYKLKIHRDGETQERTVDLPETFNYLLGLEVQKRFGSPRERAAPISCSHRRRRRLRARRLIMRLGGRRLAATRLTYYLPNGRTAVVIWRDIQGWTDKDFQQRGDDRRRSKMDAGCGRGLCERRFEHPERTVAGRHLQASAIRSCGGIDGEGNNERKRALHPTGAATRSASVVVPSAGIRRQS